MTKPQVISIVCRRHDSVRIAEIELTPMGPEFVGQLKSPLRNERTGPRREPWPLDEARVNLLDARTQRWITTGIQTTLLTYCRRCDRDYALGIEWLQGLTKDGPRTVLCPNDVLASPE